MSSGHTAKREDNGLTLTILGCGELGTSILSGILSSISSPSAPHSESPSPSDTAGPPQTLTRFIACVRRPATAEQLRETFPSPSVTVLQNENIRGVKEADVVLLGCKTAHLNDILQASGMREALKGKLLLSVLAGISISQIEKIVYGSVNDELTDPESRCRIVRVMPNTASLVRESMTVIGISTPPLSDSQAALLTWIFTRIGRVVHLPPSLFDVSTALCGSGPAFFALLLEAITDGAVAMGLPRADAQYMAAQTMRGTSALVLNGEHPALVREKVGTPGGCTMGGLMVLEEGNARGTVARAVREATVIASQLGKGVQNVNGTRF